jgi:UDP-glucose 4-epimerase
MRIVVTGASGNVGSALLRRLAASGEHEVVGVARRRPEPVWPFDTASWVEADLTSDDDTDLLRHACLGADAVVHLAWGFQPSHREDRLAALGVGGTGRVVEAVVATRVPHLVHMSSVGAYSPKRDDTPVDEGWPTEGVPTSMYSRHKASAERMLDDLEALAPDLVVSRMRPGIVGQHTAGSALLRYGLPALVPAAVLEHVPVLPLDRGLTVPIVHADDVADAVVRVLGSRAPGAFNLAAPTPVTAQDIADVLGARLLHVPSAVVRAAVSSSWHARLQPVDPGWVDLGFAVPLLDTRRATAELGWSATHEGPTVLAETIEGMRTAAADASPVLRPRSVVASMGRFVQRGPVSSRPLP